MWRWAIRITAAFLGLILLLAGIVHLVLQSKWLEDLVYTHVSERTGLEITGASLEVGWGGATTLRDAVVKMPLNDEVFLAVDQIELHHEIIPLLILGRPANVQSVELKQPRMHLRRYEDGRWNAQHAWARLRARLDSQDREDKEPSLPRLVIREALIQVDEPNGTTQALGPLSFQARPQGQLLWAFELEWPQAAQVEGQLLEGPDWAHEAGFNVEGLETLIRSVLGQKVSPVRMAGRWQGSIQQDSLRGTLSLENLTAGQLTLQGDVLIEGGPGRIIVRPRGLVIQEPNLAGEPVRLAGGAIRITDEQVNIQGLNATTGPLVGHVSGHWDLAVRTGAFSGSWVASLDGQAAEYYGTYDVSVKSPEPGRRGAQVRVTAQAETSFGTGNMTAVAEGTGADWRQSQWRLSLPAFVWSRNDRQVDLTGAAAAVNLEWPVVRLTSLELPPAERARGNAEYHVDTGRWSGRLEVEDLDLEVLGREDLDVLLVADGDEQTAYISELRMAEDGRTTVVEGRLSFHDRGLQNVRLVADWPADSARPGRSQEQRPVGRWHLEADVTGQVQPLDVKATGELTGQNVALGKQTVSRVEVPIQASVNAERVGLVTQPFTLLAGTWRVTGQHDRSKGQTQVTVVADGLSLEAAAGMAGLPLTSQGRAHAEMQLALPDFDLQRVVAIGSWSADDINIPPLQAERARGRLRISHGIVRFDDIQLEQGLGEARASMEFRLDDPQILSVELKADGWPVRLEDQPVALLADTQAKLRLNVITRSVHGEAEVSGRIRLQDQDLGCLRFTAVMEEQTLGIREFCAETLNGSVEGRARIPLNRWTDSEAWFTWQGIEPNRLGPWLPQLRRFEGTVTGSLAIEQVPKEARPPEPMRLVLDADIVNGSFGPAQVDVCRIIGYLGRGRLLVDRADFQVLDGQLNARARVSRHAGKHYASVSADFNDLDLNQLVHAIDPNAAEYVGRLAGTATILSSSERGSLGGDATIRLTESDLAGNGVVQALYGVLNLRFGERQPTGTGEVALRFDGPSVIVPSVAYFNRGVEIRGAGQLKNVALGSESPVDGYAVASTRVLKGIELPGVDSLDRLLATFQTGAASVRIGGTLDDVKVDVVPLPMVLSSFRRLLWAQLRN